MKVEFWLVGFCNSEYRRNQKNCNGLHIHFFPGSFAQLTWTHQSRYHPAGDRKGEDEALRTVSRYLTFTSTWTHHPSSYSLFLSSALETTRESSHSLRHARYQNPQVTTEAKPTPTRRGWDEGEEGEETVKHFARILNVKKGGTEMRAGNLFPWSDLLSEHSSRHTGHPKHTQFRKGPILNKYTNQQYPDSLSQQHCHMQKN